ncbi:apolipoprotein N-acyltransferase [bacterium]|nr:apolipoprotein N-acyltransferase [bacterium]
MGLLWGLPLLFPSLWLLPFFTLIPAAIAANKWSAGALARAAFLACFAHHLVAVKWITTLGLFPWLLIPLIISVELALSATLLVWIREKTSPEWWGRVFLFPSIWFLYETLRALGPWAWTWTHLSHHLTGAPSLLGGAKWIGGTGLGFVIALIASSWSYRRRFPWTRMVVGFGLALFAGSLLIPAPTPSGTIDVAAIAHGYSVRDGWGASSADDAATFYLRESFGEGADIIAWPESAPVAQYPDAIVGALARKLDTPILYGDYTYQEGNYYNLYGGADRTGEALPSYRKRVLVPMGERIFFRPFVTQFLPGYLWPEDDATPGPGDPPLSVAGTTVGPLLCWETLFAPLARDHVLGGAEWLLAATNTSWFDPTATEMITRFQALRAIENGRTLLSVVTGGGSSMVDARGRNIWQASLGEDVAEVVSVPLHNTLTLYTKWGDWPLILFSVFLLGFAMIQKR